MTKLLTGIGLQVLAGLLLRALGNSYFAMPAFVLLVIPLWIGSVILLLTSGTGPAALRFLLALWPVATILTLLADGIFGWYGLRHEIFLIPEDFRGRVMVYFEDPAGVPPAMEGSSLVLRIGKDGVLRTQASEVRWTSLLLRGDPASRGDRTRREFYFVNAAGVRTRKLEYVERHAGNAGAFGVSTFGIWDEGDVAGVRKVRFWVGTEADIPAQHRIGH